MAKGRKSKKKQSPEQGKFAVSFGKAASGWLYFEVQPFGKLAATCYNDPFPKMLDWLEAVADGAEVARWVIDYEGGADQLIFSAAAQLWFSHSKAQLIFASGDEKFCGAPASCLVTRRQVVGGFYESFRSFVESDRFQSDAWESRLRPGETFDDLPEDEHDWDGERLAPLRSRRIEAYLRPQSEQLALIEQPHFEWRPVRDN